MCDWLRHGVNTCDVGGGRLLPISPIHPRRSVGAGSQQRLRGQVDRDSVLRCRQMQHVLLQLRQWLS